MLDVRVTHRQGDFTLDCAFTAPLGLTALFGRSGSGKTSVIHAVAGLMRPDVGRIAVGEHVLCDTARGLCLPPEARRVGYIFQDARLFPHMTVAQNLRYGARFAPKGAEGAREADVVEMLGIGALLFRRPAALSGGEKARVAIGRALLAKPELLLADEPLAALDAERKAEILPYFERLRDDFGLPILYVSHSASEVARLATTVIALEAGRVVGQGPAEDILGDASITPLGAEEAGAVLPARVIAHLPDGLSELDSGGQCLLLPQVTAPVGAALRVHIAARDVMLALDRPQGISALNVLPATITGLCHGKGPGVLVQMDMGGHPLLARITRRSAEALALAEGRTVHAVVKAVSVPKGDVGSQP